MKPSFKNLVTVILLIAVISCTKEPLKNPAAVSTQTQDNATQKTAGHYIGERFGGGIIFIMNSKRTHGLIADTADLPYGSWWNGTYITTGATRTDILGGASNTRKIILAQGTSGSYPALECSQSTRSGYTDWYLPSKDALNELYKQRSVVGGFYINYYWSSSEDGPYLAWYQYFVDGLQYANSKYLAGGVRAIRAF